MLLPFLLILKTVDPW